ncbi:LOW QUALITY PROTEIN: hypothetical protein CVT26_011174 [Gymnopilus dilepis]|uniref:Uncharacterized protein n=1 Tax=Gymnopilus dilepis TaxID=231916 RepID=A0A409VJU0_9AGAR|nr:LOW QUALITY PROTEIN: hypothetical protein CVT26_011174 [Gymnopilus dilepis]
MSNKPESPKEHSLYDFLEEWQNTCLFDYQLTFTEAIESLSSKSGKRLIEARAGTGQRASTWTLFDTRTNQEAILVHAAVWRSNTNFDTGNFVPAGETPPNHIPDNRIQKIPSFKCEIAYTIDTGVEDSFYNNLEFYSNSDETVIYARDIEILEEYIQSVKGFNRDKLERSPWQNGTHRDSYSLTTKLFVKRTANVKEPNYEPHEWLVKGVKGQKKRDYVLNPRRPAYFDLVNNKAVVLQNSKPPRYKAGDIVWFAFKVSFYVASQYWSSDLTPIEFIRVARGARYGLNSAEDLDDEDEIDKPKKTLRDGAAISVIARNPHDEPKNLKRKKDDASDTDKTLSSDAADSNDGDKDLTDEDPEKTDDTKETTPQSTEDKSPPKSPSPSQVPPPEIPAPKAAASSRKKAKKSKA